MDATFSPIPMPLAVGGRGDSFTFMVEDFDLDASHLSPNRDPTVPSSPAHSLVGISGGVLKPRRNSFDFYVNGGRNRSLSFEFFNMDVPANQHEAAHRQPMVPHGDWSPEDALLMAATPKGMSGLKRGHFSSHLLGSGGVSFGGFGAPALGVGADAPDAASVSSSSSAAAAVVKPPPKKKQKREKKTKKPRAKKAPKDKKKTRGPRKPRAKKNAQAVPLVDPDVPRIGAYTLEERKAKIKAWILKSKRRVWDKKIKYGCRKRLADARPRYKGRFVKSLPTEKLSIARLNADPALLAAMEATRLWKARVEARAAAIARGETPPDMMLPKPKSVADIISQKSSSKAAKGSAKKSSATASAAAASTDEESEPPTAHSTPRVPRSASVTPVGSASPKSKNAQGSSSPVTVNNKTLMSNSKAVIA